MRSMTPGQRRLDQPPGAAAWTAQAQVEVEHHRAVFDEQVAVALRGDRQTVGPRASSARVRARIARADIALPRRAGRRRRARDAGAKRTVSPGRSWPIFHSRFGRDHRGRADEAAEARAVGAEDDRHVAGEIDRADGVGVVVDVGGMQARLAAVGAGPARLRADQAHAGAGAEL